MEIRNIVDLIGGTNKLARSLGIKPQAVSQWIANDSVPLKRVPSLARLAKERGLPLRPEDIEAILTGMLLEPEDSRYLI